MHLADAKYQRTRARVEDYFDRTATKTWERLTSDAPVSGIRATVRAGRERMQRAMLAELPGDLNGKRVLDAGCGTGTVSVMLANRRADVLGLDLSPSLIEIAETRAPDRIAGSLDFQVGDLRDASHGKFDYVIGLDSLIYYNSVDIGSILAELAPRVAQKIIFTMPPRTPLLMAMWRAGKVFPRSNRSPVMVPQSASQIAQAAKAAGARGALAEKETVKSGFYFSTLLTFETGGQG